MIRLILPCLLLAACATPETDSYSLGRGIANYDELRRETETCNQRGGTIQAKQQGGDPAQLANYTCVIPKGR